VYQLALVKKSTPPARVDLQARAGRQLAKIEERRRLRSEAKEDCSATGAKCGTRRRRRGTRTLLAKSTATPPEFAAFARERGGFATAQGDGAAARLLNNSPRRSDETSAGD